MGDSISREEHAEFARRMAAENKRLEDENTRQNHRLDNLEESVRQIGMLTTSVEKLAVNMGVMVEEQKKFGERLSALEGQDGKKWRAAVIKGIEVIVAAAVGFVLAKLGL